MPTGVSWKKDERRQHRAALKYKKVEGDKWSIDTSKDRGAVRPIDLVSRDPDRLREFDSKEAAVMHARLQLRLRHIAWAELSLKLKPASNRWMIQRCF